LSNARRVSSVHSIASAPINSAATLCRSIRARATVLRCLGETMELVADVSIGEEPTFSQVMLADGTQTEW
jgi:hypothetical protein